MSSETGSQSHECRCQFWRSCACITSYKLFVFERDGVMVYELFRNDRIRRNPTRSMRRAYSTWSFSRVTDCAADATDKADSDPFVDGFGKERACSDGNEGRSWTK